ncbi:MAG: hypothetical protein II085_03280, partial [Alphaproteobacteria bacterium]|nr:hypothetical protein [Alphaproteobacteria bacterium]
MSGVQRERAEAGVLLLNVRLAQKAKHGIAVKRERTRQFPLPPPIIVLIRGIFLFQSTITNLLQFIKNFHVYADKRVLVFFFALISVIYRQIWEYC